ncbi:phage tail tape measure protein [Eubacterium sp. AM47-9]|nr:phage tail tape measure protein [Eubacterium sp. AM47-9]
MNSDGSIVIDTKLDQSGLNKGITAMKNTVAAGSAAVVALVAAMSTAVVSLGSEFEQANAKASTLFGDAQVDVAQYQGKLLELSNKTGLAASELGNTMYDALSAGIPASDDMSESLGFLEKNSKLAKAGFTDINTATTATAKVLNAYKMDVSETDRIHKVLMQTQNKGITTVNELGSVLSQVTPTASAMGVSFEQVGAALAGMTAQGTPTAQATTQLNQLIAELGKNGTQANKAMMKMYEEMGYGKKSFKELMNEGVTLVDIIVDMEGYAADNKKSLIDMFGSLEAGKAALSMAGDNAQTFVNNLEAMETQTDVVGEAYDKVTDTFKEKSKMVINSLENVGIQAYSKFEEPLKGAMDSAQESINELSRDMENGKLGESVDKIAEGFGVLITKTIELAADALPPLINGFAFVVDSGTELATVLATVGGGMAALKAYNIAKATVMPLKRSFDEAVLSLKLFQGANAGTTLSQAALNHTLTMGEVAVGVLTGKINLSTAAHAAWNAVKAADPTLMIVAAVGALTAGIVALTLTMGDADEETKQLQATLDETNDKWKDLKETQEENLKNDLSQIENTQKLRNELSYLVDENGKVKKGYEARANFILGELNEALGTEYTMTDGIIGKYNELNGNIDELIQKKRVKAILDAQEPLYQEAINKQMQEANQIAELNNSILDKQAEKQKIENELVKEYGTNWQKGASEAKDARATTYWIMEDDINKKQKLLNGYEKSYNEHTNTIVNYENNMTLASSKNAKDWAKIQTDIKESAGETYQEKKKLLEKEEAGAKYHYESLLKKQKNGDKKVTEAQIKAAKERVEEKEKEIKELTEVVDTRSPEYSSAVKNMSLKAMEMFRGDTEKYFGVSQEKYNNVVKGLRSKDPDIRKKAEKTAEEMLFKLKSKDDQYSKVGANVVNGVINGIDDTSSSLFSKMSSLGTSMLDAFKIALDIKSPSRKFAKEARFIPSGVALGVRQNAKVAEKSVEELSNKMLKSFSSFDISEMVQKMKASVNAEQLRMSSSISSSIQYEIKQASNEPSMNYQQSVIDYDKLRDIFVEAVSGISVKYDNRTLGRIVKEVI